MVRHQMAVKPARSPRRGATLIELLVALLLFDLSLLSLAAVSALAARRVGDAGRRNRAAIAAASRVEALTATPCTSASSGSQILERGVTEVWMSVPLASGMEVSDSIRLESHQSEALVVRARRVC